MIVAGCHIKVGRSYIIQGGGSSGSLLVHIVVMELFFLRLGVFGIPTSRPRMFYSQAPCMVVVLFSLRSTVNYIHQRPLARTSDLIGLLGCRIRPS